MGSRYLSLQSSYQNHANNSRRFIYYDSNSISHILLTCHDAIKLMLLFILVLHSFVTNLYQILKTSFLHLYLSRLSFVQILCVTSLPALISPAFTGTNLNVANQVNAYIYGSTVGSKRASRNRRRGSQLGFKLSGFSDKIQ